MQAVRFRVGLDADLHTDVVMTIRDRTVQYKSEATVLPWLVDDPDSRVWDDLSSRTHRFRFGGLHETDREGVGRDVAELLVPGPLHDPLTEALREDTHVKPTLLLGLVDPRLA